MSGHSKWSTIKRQKGAADAKRGNVFTKLGNAIAVAVRQGGGIADPGENFRLRLAMEKAHLANMPKDNIQRAIDRGVGKGGEGELSEAIFEGFGPGGAAVMVGVITDNTTRTASALRGIFEKRGGSLGGPGAVGYLFSKVGEIRITNNPITQSTNNPITMDKVLEAAVAAEALDVEEDALGFSVFTKPSDWHRVKETLTARGFPVEEASLVYRPHKEAMILLPADKREPLLGLLSALEELDEVQEVYTNAIV